MEHTLQQTLHTTCTAIQIYKGMVWRVWAVWSGTGGKPHRHTDNGPDAYRIARFCHTHCLCPSVCVCMCVYVYPCVCACVLSCVCVCVCVLYVSVFQSWDQKTWVRHLSYSHNHHCLCLRLSLSVTVSVSLSLSVACVCLWDMTHSLMTEQMCTRWCMGERTDHIMEPTIGTRLVACPLFPRG